MKHQIKKRKILFIIILLLILALAILLADSNTRLVTTEYLVYSERLPKAFDGMRIVQLSDIHGKEFGTDNVKLLDAVKAAQPDIIALTGDLFDEHTEPYYPVSICRDLVKIAPVYYVSGNHEWSDNPRSTFAAMEAEGVNVMRNEYVILEQAGESIVLAGVDDPNGPYDMITRESFTSKIKAETNDFILMLCHRNTEFETWVKLNVDLVLSGHAHGGLIRLPFIGGILTHSEDSGSKRIEGVFIEGNTTMVVSRGIGNTGIIPRLNNNPEIVIIELKVN